MGQRKKLAITAISGNEEKWVKQWCASVMRTNPDIVIVSLTRYDDNSEVLFREGIPEDKLLLLKNPWEDSFSEARNHYLDAMPDDIDYIFFLDLDEVITEESYEIMEQFLHYEMEDHPMVLVNIYNSVNNTGATANLFYPRLYPWRDKAGKKLNPRFENTVHNQNVYPPDVKMPVAIRNGISIFHYGYSLSPEEMKEKHLRSENLLRKAIEKKPDSWFDHLNLAQLLRAKGDHIGTSKHAEIVVNLTKEKALAKNPKFVSAYLMAKEQWSTSCLARRIPEDAIAHAKDALEIKNDYLDAIMDVAHGFLEMKQWDDAEFWLNRYLFVRSRYDETKDNTNFILNHLNSSFMALYHLGIVYGVRHNWKKASEYFLKSYKEEPNFQDVFIKYIHTLRMMGESNRLHQEVSRYMADHADKDYMVYYYFAQTELENCNIEAAKFNFYQAKHLSKDKPEHKKIADCFETLTNLFGPVSNVFFNTDQKIHDIEKRVR